MTPRTWLPDPSHYPEQLTPLSATVWFEAIGRGIHEAMREIRGPFGGFVARTELGWAYEGELEPEWEPEDGALERAGRALPDRWERDIAPRVREITSILGSLRPERLDPREAAREFDRMWDLVLEQWTLHFSAVLPAQADIELVHDVYVEATGDTDPLAPYRLLQGPNESMEADGALRRLADRARELDMADVLVAFPRGPALERLRLTEAGRGWLRDLDSYLQRYGGRARLHELSLPREVEDPAITLDSIRLFLESDLAPSPREGPKAAAAQREPARLPPAVERVLEVGRFAYALKESHVYHIDYPGLLATREALLGFGRRLVAEGRLDVLEDVWMFYRSELREAVAGEDLAPRELVQVRREEMARGLAEGPRPFLGEPPKAGERAEILEKFYGRAGGPRSGRHLEGTAASPGTGVGPARVVTGDSGFASVRPGDVLVAATTTPAWTPLFPSLQGLVTETGGILSHAAIVAREYGLPAVVGVAEATRLVPQGARLRVDGTAGTVQVG